MALVMHKGQPLYGQKPNIAIDLFENSLSSLAPSYLTNKLNEKIMNGLTDKSGTVITTNDGNTIVCNYDDGTKETLDITEEGTVFTNCVYNKDGVLLKKMVSTVDTKTGSIRNDVTYDGSVNGIVRFADATWDEIGIMLMRHYSGIINLADFWSVGDVKSIKYGPMAATGVSEFHNGNEQKVVILGFDHDTISGGSKAAITIGFLNGLGSNGYMHPENLNAGGWGASNRRTWCNNTLFNALPKGLRELIKPVDKYYTIGNKSSVISTCTDKCFLLSESEIVGYAANHSFTTEGNQYPFFLGLDAIKKKQSDNVSGYDNWLTRSADKYSNTKYVYVESDGDINTCDANSQYQIVPAFCI